MKRAGLMLWLMALVYAAQAQQDSSWVRYQGGFDFREGIYQDFAAFRQNTPSIALEKLSDEQGSAIHDIRRTERFFHVDSTGQRREIELDKTWGFCNNNIVYLRAGDGFYRIGLMGALCHVLFEYSYRQFDPYYGIGTTTQTVQVQYLLDMSSGAFVPFNDAGMGQAIAGDIIMKEEWDHLGKKQRRKPEVLHQYMRRYNDRHPLYFPP